MIPIPVIGTPECLLVILAVDCSGMLLCLIRNLKLGILVWRREFKKFKVFIVVLYVGMRTCRQRVDRCSILALHCCAITSSCDRMGCLKIDQTKQVLFSILTGLVDVSSSSIDCCLKLECETNLGAEINTGPRTHRRARWEATM